MPILVPTRYAPTRAIRTRAKTGNKGFRPSTFIVGCIFGLSVALAAKVGQVQAWGRWPANTEEVEIASGQEEHHKHATSSPSFGFRKQRDCQCDHDFIANAVEKAMRSVVNISVETDASTILHKKSLISSGSGFFIDERGSILTNAHVVTDMSVDSTLTVTTSDGAQYDGYIHSLDTPSDLAVVKIRPKTGDIPIRWPVLKMSSNMHLRPGHWVVAIGSPFGLHNTVTAGVVSSGRRQTAEIGTGSDVRVEYIQTDCVVHEGSSGGPLINLDGEVVGINTQRAESEGISFAIRVDNAMDIIHQLHTEGRVVRPWLGCRMVTITSQVRQQLRSEGPMKYIPPTSDGVLITSVFPESPCAKAGMSEGDVIVAVNDKTVHSSQEVFKALGLRIHVPVKLKVKRSVPLDMDWDGRTRRWETDDLDVMVTPEEFDIAIHGTESDPVN
ncbi:trypsin-like cysteine/serine peptidase domain-containing protein [Phlyctochytrium arcticum]|nr:trypsin-like cysteine/serine peptidase domain-containing protein [Phlyctochytrium arcticum]